MDFVAFKKFDVRERVEALTTLLQEQGIEFKVTEDRSSLDSLYGGDRPTHYYLNLKQADFERANALLFSIGEKEMDLVGKDHYLYTFTDEELFEVLSKPDEWNELDFNLSKRILKERGKEINDDTIDLLRKQRIKDLAQPDESHTTWIYAGYIMAILGGILGVFIGWHLTSFKKTLPNGQRVYGHSESDRRHGRWILAIGAIMFVIWMSVRLNANFPS